MLYKGLKEASLRRKTVPSEPCVASVFDQNTLIIIIFCCLLLRVTTKPLSSFVYCIDNGFVYPHAPIGPGLYLKI